MHSCSLANIGNNKMKRIITLLISFVCVQSLIGQNQITRIQEPKAPYPYYSEEISFQNVEDSVTIEGPLTLPNKDKQKKWPIVILITGSGPQDRDYNARTHKPYLVLGDYLTRNGIGVLRFDERGVGASTGDFKSATTLEFAQDVKSAVDYLLTRNDIDMSKIGLLGHSQGGEVAMMVASEHTAINYMVLLATVGLDGYQHGLLQREALNRAKGMSEEEIAFDRKLSHSFMQEIKEYRETDSLKFKIKEFAVNSVKNYPFIVPKNVSKKQFVDGIVAEYTNPQMLHYLGKNPKSYLENIDCPVLVMSGDRDIIVPHEPNTRLITEILLEGGNNDVSVRIIPKLNHFMQECEIGTWEERNTLEQTLSPEAMSAILDWIKIKTK